MAFENKEGQQIPNVTFRTRINSHWVNVSTDELFKDKTVVLFALPGAFTPTCSSTHLPRYNELAPVFFNNGIDHILCLSVNDTFVMNEWARGQEAENIILLPDGNGDFTAAMGMLVDKNDLGFGQRSWRYSMLVKNGIIEKMFIEPASGDDPLTVSDADTMLSYLNPHAVKPPVATIFTKTGCPYCTKAKAALEDAGIDYEEVVISQRGVTSRTLRAVANRDTVPQVFIEGRHIGGSDELSAYLAKPQHSW